MILHVFNNQKKFSKPYFQMLKDNGIDMKTFHLIHYGKREDFFLELGIKTLFIRNFWTPIGCFRMYQEMLKADKIIVHSLAAPWLLLILAYSKKIADKVYWVIWGKDLYLFKLLNKQFFYHRIYEFFREKAFDNIHHVITGFYEDYVLANQWYGVSAEVIECHSLYPYAYDFSEIEENMHDDKYTILLGNSASKTNNHIEALFSLSNFTDKIEKIYCPLSYNGNNKYKNEVIKIGKELFSERFIAMLDFVTKEEYFKILSNVDIGYFNYNRQEGLGNIYSLIMKGKTIYLKKDTSSYKFFIRKGIKIFNIEDTSILRRLSDREIMENRKKLSPLIDVKKSISIWKEVFEKV